MKTIKRIVVCIIIIILVCIGIKILRYKIEDNNNRYKMSMAIKELLNNETMSPYFDEKDLNYIKYAKNENVNHYDITNFINNYIDCITKSIEAKVNDVENQMYQFYSPYNYAEYIGYSYYKQIAKYVGDIFISSMQSDVAKYIVRHITYEDINMYKDGTFEQNIKLKLEKYFTHEKDDKWFIDLNYDKHIELPYGVYVDYVADKKKTVNNIREFLEIKILRGELKKIKAKNFSNDTIKVKYKFETFDKKIEEGILKVGIKLEKDDRLKIDANYFTHLYYTNRNMPTLRAGQHDYDEARERQIQEDYELGLGGPSPILGDWEAEAQGYTYEPSKVMTVEEIYESLINKYNESTASDAKEKVALFEDLLRHTIEGSK